MEVLRRAIFWGVWSALLAMPLLGARLQQDGMELLVQWRPMLVLAAGVVGAAVGGFFSQPVILGLRWFYRRVIAIVSLPVRNFDGKLRAAAWLDPAKGQYLLLLVLVGAAAAFPFFASRGGLSFATLALLYVILGLGLNVVVGLAGLLDLGYVAFYAVGAYLYAMLSVYFGWSFWICLPLAGMAAALVGILLGFPVLRLRGDYLAIATLGFGEIVRILLNNLDDFTGGPDGIGGIPKPSFFGLEFTRRPAEGAVPFHEFFGLDFDGGHSRVFIYLLILAMAVITYLVVRRLQRLPVGRAWEALREDEIACRSLGLNRTSIKLSAFAIGASFGGFAGCFYAALQGHINPESFIFLESVIVLAIVVLGGMGSQAGIILAALLVTYLQLSGLFQEYRMLVFGLAMLLMITWRPQGLIPAKRPRLELRR